MKNIMRSGLIALCMAGVAAAQEAKPAATVRPSTSGTIKDLQIRGRIQTQMGATSVENDEGSSDYSTAEIRRARMGLRATLFDNIRAQIEANLVPGADLSMRSAFLQWREYKPAYIKVGYDKPWSSIDENTSSAEILTIERSLISNLIAPGPLTGLSLDGSLSWLEYGVGMYTARDNVNTANESARYLYNAMAELKLDDVLSDTLRFRANVMSNDDETGKLRYDDTLSLGVRLGHGGFAVVGEYILAAKGDDDTTGWYVMPSYMLTDKLQVVGSFEMAASDRKTGLRAPSRYMRSAPGLKVIEDKLDDGTVKRTDPQTGNEYMAAYVGLNYYLSGHNNKLMAGVEFAELDNTLHGTVEATTFTCAWRMLF